MEGAAAVFEGWAGACCVAGRVRLAGSRVVAFAACGVVGDEGGDV